MPEPLPPEHSELPAHPDRIDSSDPAVASHPWRGIVLVALTVALLTLIVVLHVTGVVGPGAH